MQEAGDGYGDPLPDRPMAETPLEGRPPGVTCELAPGALVDLNGGHFKIKPVGLRCVVLEALAGTSIRWVS